MNEYFCIPVLLGCHFQKKLTVFDTIFSSVCKHLKHILIHTVWTQKFLIHPRPGLLQPARPWVNLRYLSRKNISYGTVEQNNVLEFFVVTNERYGIFSIAFSRCFTVFNSRLAHYFNPQFLYFYIRCWSFNLNLLITWASFYTTFKSVLFSKFDGYPMWCLESNWWSC